MSTITKSEAIGIILAVEGDLANQKERFGVLQSFNRLVIQGMVNIVLKSDISDPDKWFKVEPEEPCDIKRKSSPNSPPEDKVESSEDEVKPKRVGLDRSKLLLVAFPGKSNPPPMQG